MAVLRRYRGVAEELAAIEAVLRSFSWLHGFRKLRLVTEKRLDIQIAFLDLALAVICYRFL